LCACSGEACWCCGQQGFPTLVSKQTASLLPRLNYLALLQIKDALEEVLRNEEPSCSSGGSGGGGPGAAGSGADGGVQSPSSGAGGDGQAAGSGARFNTCLLNLYEDGSRYVGWHKDDERGLGDDPEIASASFGGTRDFQLREAGPGSAAGGGRKLCVPLGNGDVLIMRGTLQRYWQHTVPKRARGVARISLTFRRVVGGGGGDGGGSCGGVRGARAGSSPSPANS
jgi:hypothetical protein